MEEILSNGLNVSELARYCQPETERYLANQPHDECYCLELLRRALANQARLVLAQFNETDLTELELPPILTSEQILAYPINSIELVEFAYQLAGSLE